MAIYGSSKEWSDSDWSTRLTAAANGYSTFSVSSNKPMTSFFNNKNAPEHIANRTGVRYSSMPLIGLKAMGIWNNRLDKLIPYIPKDAWIAGGFLRSIIAGEDDSNGDIDFFFGSEDGFNSVLELIKNPIQGSERGFGYYNIPEYDDIKKLRIIDCESIANFRPNIQLVRLFWFDKPEHVIDSFDFTVCQFITDGKTLWFNPQGFADVKTKTLRMHRETGDPIAILNRILKYQSKGYKIAAEEFNIAESNAIRVLGNPDQMTKYFYLDKLETSAHKRSVSPVQRALDYLETAPFSAAVYTKTVKKKSVNKKPKISLDTPVKMKYVWDGS